LGHFIAAIFNEPELKETLIFKGGTCSKKCWFEEYRFSEDLDFTSKSQELELTQEHLKFITKYVEDNTEVKTHIVSLKCLDRSLSPQNPLYGDFFVYILLKKDIK
jgi:predicted nucleotidyltransferase component of viral defense system